MPSWTNYRGPLLFAHRGASAELPENSLAAFGCGLERGADVLEMDVHATSDGKFVVAHDDSGLRAAGVERRIADCTLAEVKSWDIGRVPTGARSAGFFAGQGFQAPTLEEALGRFPGALFNVDVKQADARTLPDLLKLIERHRAAERVLLTSFSWLTLRRIRALGYPGPTGLSRVEVGQLVFLPAAINKLMGIPGVRVQVPVRHRSVELADREFIDKCHGLGLAVDFWVINQPDQADQLLQMGADGIMTDDPGVISEVFRRSERTAGWRERRK